MNNKQKENPKMNTQQNKDIEFPTRTPRQKKLWIIPWLVIVGVLVFCSFGEWTCPTCRGTGEKIIKCENCKGTGIIKRKLYLPFGSSFERPSYKCKKCNGEKTEKVTCNKCEGKGELQAWKIIL